MGKKGKKNQAGKMKLSVIDVFFQSLNFHIDIRPRDESITLGRLLDYIDTPVDVHERIVTSTLYRNKDHPLVSKLFDLTQYGDLGAFKTKLKEEAAKNNKSIYSQLIHPDSPGRSEQDELLRLNEDLVDLDTLLIFSNAFTYLEGYYLIMVTSRIVNNLLLFDVNPLLILLTEKTAFHITAEKLQALIDKMPEEDRINLSLMLQSTDSLYHRALGAVIDNDEEYFKTLLEPSSADFQTNIDMALTLSARYEHHNIAEYAFKQYIEYKAIIGTLEYDFYEKLLMNAGYAFIRGDQGISKLFIQPAIWKIYSPEDQIKLLNVILSRAGITTTNALIRDLYNNNLLTLQLVNRIMLNVVDKYKAEIARVFEPYYEDVIKNHIKETVPEEQLEGYYAFIEFIFEYQKLAEKDKEAFVSSKYDQIKSQLAGIDRAKLLDIEEFQEFIDQVDREVALRWLDAELSASDKALSDAKPKAFKNKNKQITKGKKNEAEAEKKHAVEVAVKTTIKDLVIEEDNGDGWTEVASKPAKPKPKNHAKATSKASHFVTKPVIGSNKLGPKPDEISLNIAKNEGGDGDGGVGKVLAEVASKLAKPKSKNHAKATSKTSNSLAEPVIEHSKLERKLEEISLNVAKNEGGDGDGGKVLAAAAFAQPVVILPDSFAAAELPEIIFFSDNSRGVDVPALSHPIVREAAPKDLKVIKLERQVQRLSREYKKMSEKYEYMKWELGALKTQAANQIFQYWQPEEVELDMRMNSAMGCRFIRSDNIQDAEGNILSVEYWQGPINGQIFQYFRDPSTGQQVFPKIEPNLQNSEEEQQKTSAQDHESGSTSGDSTSAGSQKAAGENKASIGDDRAETSENILSLESQAPEEIILSIITKLAFEAVINPKDKEDKESVAEAQNQFEEGQVVRVKYEENNELEDGFLSDMHNSSYRPDLLAKMIFNVIHAPLFFDEQAVKMRGVEGQYEGVYY